MSVNVVFTVTAFVALSMSAAAVKEPVQVTPPSRVENEPKAPPLAVNILLLKVLTASLMVIVTVAVSPICNALSLIVTELTEGAV